MVTFLVTESNYFRWTTFELSLRVVGLIVPSPQKMCSQVLIPATSECDII
jgi:hypothetical protein